MAQGQYLLSIQYVKPNYIVSHHYYHNRTRGETNHDGVYEIWLRLEASKPFAVFQFNYEVIRISYSQSGLKIETLKQ